MQNRLLYIILCIAALIRLYTLDHGLPDIYEEATPMRQAWEMWHGANGHIDLNPHFFNYPAFYFYLQLVLQGIYFGLNILIGRMDTLSDIQHLYDSNPTEMVLLARLLNATLGVGSIWATYRLGCLFHNEKTGLLAATIMALMPTPVHTSRIILVDVPLLFFGILSLRQSLLIFRHNTLQHHLWAGLWIGLATASKYTGALFILPLITAHICREMTFYKLWQQKEKMALGCLVALGTFLFTNPYILFDFQAFWADFSFERNHMALGHFGVDADRTPIAYLQDLGSNFGILLIPCLLWGSVPIFKQKSKHQIPILVFAILYLTLISTWSMGAAHYLLPILPPLALITAIGLQDILLKLKQSGPLALTIALCLCISPSYHTVQNLITQTKPDTRAQAKKWITNHIPPGVIIAQEYYTPDLPPNQYILFRLPIDTVRPELVAPFYHIQWYTDFDYIITSDGVSTRYAQNPEKFQLQMQFYHDLEQQWKQIASFSGNSHSGPAIRIYQRQGPNAPQDVYPSVQYTTLVGANTHVVSDLLENLARTFAQKMWYAKAIDIYRHLHDMLPPTSETLTKLGVLFYQTNQNEKAIQVWQQALVKAPQSIALHTNLGALYHQQGNISQAIHHWQQGLKLAPSDKDLLNNLIFIYRQTNQIEHAIQTVQNALTLYPNDATLQSILNDLQGHKKTPTK